MRIGVSAWLCAFGIMTHAAEAMPKTGDFFPSVQGQDLTGQVRRTDEFAGRRTLVVSISDRDGAEAMRAWFGAATTRLATDISSKAIISFSVPFFIPTDAVRSRAREQVPRAFWQDTLLDRGDMAKRLDEPKSQIPYVYALDEHGRVIAAIHAAVDAPESTLIWAALTSR